MNDFREPVAGRVGRSKKALAAALAWAILLTIAVPAGAEGPRFTRGTYRGWAAWNWSSGPLRLHVVPEIGGRIIQFALGDQEFFWVNPRLAGKPPSASGLAPDGGWLNYGGEKLWPAPQGWDNEEQWPGPPDAVLDGRPHRAEAMDDCAAVRLTSGDDPRSGIRLSRTVRPLPGRSGVRFDAVMTNVSEKPRRWGIWSVAQLDASKRPGPGWNPRLRSYCAANPQSKHPRGFRVLFGEPDNPSFRLDQPRGIVCSDYRYQVGKIAIDSPAGWVAAVDGVSGAVFVQRFTFESGKEYPDGASVEIWHNGAGVIRAYKKTMQMADDPVENPCVCENEVLSPLARLAPGESYAWRYEWSAANIGGDFPVVGCNDAGVVAEPLQATADGGKVRLRGRFGTSAEGRLSLVCRAADGRGLKMLVLDAAASPLRPLVLDQAVEVPPGTDRMALEIVPARGGPLTLAETGLPAPHASTGRWIEAEDFVGQRGSQAPSYAMASLRIIVPHSPGKPRLGPAKQ
jgi:hypothetical protein